MPKAKPYAIPKQLVWDAYQRVKANRGAAGVDGESLAAFEQGPEGQPLQGLESDVVGLVLPAAGAARRDSEGQRRHAPARHSHGRRSSSADGREDGPGAPRGARPSTRTPTAIGPAGRRSTRWGWPGSGAGTPTGSSIWTSKPSLIPFRMIWSSAPWHTTPTCRGSGCTLPGGSVPRCSGQTAPWSRGPRARRKAGWPVRCWPISSCTTRSMPGCSGSYPRIRFERYADDVLVHCRSEQEAQAVLAAIRGRFLRVRSGASSHEDPDRLLQGRRPAWGVDACAVRLPRVHLPTSTGEESLGEVLCELPARDQHPGRYGDPADHP